MADSLQAHLQQVLARRMAAQSPAVQQRLARRRAALDSGVAPEADLTPVVRKAAGISALGALNAELAGRDVSAATPAGEPVPASVRELQSVRRFGTTWAKVAAEQQMLEALAKAPPNAGPLNSHRLMLRSLTLMRKLSPDYLRHFLAHIDSLFWLEDSVAKLPKPATKTARAVKRKS